MFELADAIDRRVGLFSQLLKDRLGEDRVTTAAQLVKLQDEVAEVLEEPSLAELADVVVVCAMAARTMDHDFHDLLTAVVTKMQVNLERDWYPTASGTARHTPEVAS